MKVTVEAVRVLLEAMRVIIEAIRKIIEALRTKSRNRVIVPARQAT